MTRKPFHKLAATIAAFSLIATPALAGGSWGGNNSGGGWGGSHSGGPNCPHPGGNTKIFNKTFIFNKNLNINKNININKNLNINKNININKNVNINKNIIINKGGGSAMASAFASAMANANANASSSSVSYSGSYSDVTVINHGGGFGGGALAVASAEASCQMQEATIVKSIHAVCVSIEGREIAASHMLRDTWIDSGYEGEVVRCIAGAHLKIVVGDVVQSDEGMAGTYSRGSVLECAVGEALRHNKDGQLKCAPAVPVPDCTERTNLRKFGTGDFFFSYRGRVCVGDQRVAQAQSGGGDMELDGGVGGGGDDY